MVVYQFIVGLFQSQLKLKIGTIVMRSDFNVLINWKSLSVVVATTDHTLVATLHQLTTKMIRLSDWVASMYNAIRYDQSIYTETFTTQVHLINFTGGTWEPQPSCQKLIRNHTTSVQLWKDGRWTWYCKIGYNQSQSDINHHACDSSGNCKQARQIIMLATMSGT